MHDADEQGDWQYRKTQTLTPWTEYEPAILGALVSANSTPELMNAYTGIAPRKSELTVLQHYSYATVSIMKRTVVTGRVTTEQ
jgi:hypothetical protein